MLRTIDRSPAGDRSLDRGLEMTEQGDLALLQDPVAIELLSSRNPARLAYTWRDGTPRVVPVNFHWDGRVFTVGTPPRAPKVSALAENGHVALTVDDAAWPYKVLLVRGIAAIEQVDDVIPEYEAATYRYLGPEAGAAWIEGLRGRPMAKVTITPNWVGVLDFVTRFPSALSA
jgi:hypothetical protein